jgi:hypothetical protein
MQLKFKILQKLKTKKKILALDESKLGETMINDPKRVEATLMDSQYNQFSR